MTKVTFIASGVFASCLWLAACSTPATIAETTAGSNEPCIPDRDALLALDLEQFDRTLGAGWRPVADKDGCKIAAADLLAEYASTRIKADDLHSKRSLAWHEGQLRAAAGQTEHALNLFAFSYRERIDNSSDTAWNLYVSATIAFLEGDRAALDDAHRKLKALPEPEYWAAAVARTEDKYGFTPVWPSNLNVVEAFQTCFGQSYQEAYSQCNQGLQAATE